jgi:PAS domain S-box-containing protein
LKDNRAGKQGSTTTTEDDDGSTSQGRKTWLHRVDATILLIGAVVSLAAYFIVKDWEVRSQETHFVRLAEARCSSVEIELVHYVHALRFVRRFFDGSQLVESDEFAEFVAPVLVDHPEIRTLGWAPRINDADRAAFERTLQADRANNTRITDSCFLKTSTVTPRREEYYPVLYSYPPAGWTTGCDLLSVPAREEAIKRARDEGGSAITEKIALGPEKADGVIIFEPIYTNGLPITTIEERRTAIRGVAMCAVRINDIIRGVLWHLEPVGIDIAVLDASASGDKQLLYQYWSRRRDTSATPIVADDEPDLRYVASFSMAGRTWELRCTASPEYKATHALWAQWAALLGGLCLTMLLAMYLRSRQRRSALIEALVEQRTGQLRESEEKFRNLASSLPEVIFETDIDGRILYVNENAYDKFGYSKDDFDRGLFPSDMLIPEDRKNAGEAIQRILLGKDIGSHEYTALCKDGSTFPIITRSRPIIQDGKPIGLRGIIFDITERKQMEDSLRERKELLSKSQEIAHVGSWSLDLKNNVLTWSDETYRIFGLKPKEFGATYEAFIQAVHPEDRELVAQKYETALKDKQPYEVVHRVLRPDGTVRIVHEKSENIADESGEVLYSLGMVHDITERIQDQVTLQEREQKISSIFTAAPIGIGLAVDRVLTEVNYRFCEMLGYTAKELIGQNAQTLYVTKEEYESVGTEKYAQIQKYGTGTVETQFKRKDGRIIDVILSSTPLDPMDLSKGVTFTAMDITGRKKAEEGLKNSEEKFRRIAERTFDIIMSADLDGLLAYVSPSITRILGYKPDELIGRNLIEFIPESEISNVVRQLKTLAAGEFLKAESSMMIRKDGTHAYVEVNAVPIIEDDKVTSSQAIIRDITERKRAEKALIKSEQKARAAFNQTFQLMGVLELDGTLLEANQTALEFAGIEEKDVLGRPLWETIWWSHSTELQDKLRDAVKKTSNGQFMRFEVSLLAYDGTLHYVDFSLKPVKDESDKVKYLVAEGHDITERKLADEALRASEEYTRLIFESVEVGIVLIDAETYTVIDANPVAVMMIGRPKSDIIGKVYHNFICPSEEGQRPITDLGQAPDNSECVLMTADGANLPILKTVISITMEGRKCLLESFVDISARVEAEEALRSSKEFSENLIETANAIVLTMDIKANITSLNSYLEKLTGYDRKEVLGKNWFNIFIPERERRHIPEVFKNVLAQMSEVSANENAIVCKNGVERIISWKNTVLKDNNDEASGVLSIGVDVTESRRAENMLRSMVLGTSTTTGEKFFQSLIEHLVEGLGVRGALVGELEESPQRTVKTLAFLDKGKQRKNIQYDLSGTPCEEVVLGCTSICFSDVRAQFPRNHILASLGIHTYVGAPMIGSSGDVLGVLAVLHDKSIADDLAIHVKSLLAVFAARAVAEIERLRSEGKLMTAKEKLQQESESLVEKNIALNQILEHIGQDMAKFREELATSTENLLMPIVEKLKKSKGHLPLKEVDHLEDAIKSILGKEIDVFRKNLTHLTGRELEICKMIRDGYSSKDIADTLFISLETVHKHRESIRRKLQIKHAHINLAAYLKSRPWPFASA